MKRYIIGSSVWFSEYEDYVVHDIDILFVCDIKKQVIFKEKGVDRIFLPKKTAKEYIEEILNAGITKSSSLFCGKFLCPQFAKDFGVTINDLELLKPFIYATDKGHQYQRIILDSYIANSDFILTKEQRDRAYDIYRDARKDRYKK